jgi:hypothetical protein
MPIKRNVAGIGSVYYQRGPGMVEDPMDRFADEATVVRPVCSGCGVPLWLTRIEPHKGRFARRTFECPHCENQITEVIELQKAAKLNARSASLPLARKAPPSGATFVSVRGK